MKRIIITALALLGLGLTILPALLVFAGTINADTHKSLMVAGFVIWFAAAPLWIRKES